MSGTGKSDSRVSAIFQVLLLPSILLVILLLPFAMNELEARERLIIRIDQKITSINEALADSAEGAEKEKPRLLISCMEMSKESVQSRINGGWAENQIPFDNIRACIAGTCSLEADVRKNGQPPDPATRRIPENSMCPGFPERLRKTNTFSSSFGWPYRWPSLSLIFFVGIVASMIGYGATTLREDRKLTGKGATLSATIAFGFLLALKSGYGLAFSGSTQLDTQNVLGLAFMGFIVGLFTEQVFELLKKFVPDTELSKTPNGKNSPGQPTDSEEKTKPDAI